MPKVLLQTYLDNIEKKTGKSVADFKKAAIAAGHFEKGQMKSTLKPAPFIAWIKKDFGLGHGHGLALYHALKDDTK